MVESMHEANLYFILGLAKGMTAEEAMKYSIKRFDYWIKYFENVKPKNANEASIIRTVIWCLENDKGGTVLHGRKDYRVPRKVSMALAAPLVLLAIGSAFSYISAKRGGG